jgi:SpoVK/Ycf46/Vps4 family AAA+-type ATPase
LNDAPADLLTGADFQLISEGHDERPGFEEMDSLIGLEDVKRRVRELVVSVEAARKLNEQRGGSAPPCYHMLFTGNPGTGKTTIARIIGKIFRENGLLRVGDLIETNRFDLVGEYIGQTGPKTVQMCRAAMGSILFIDEAYLLSTGRHDDKDFGREAIGALVAEMENNRDRFMVILAGYSDEMETMLSANPGLRGRIPHRLHFPNYSREELFQIFKMQISRKFEYDDALITAAEDFFGSLTEDYLNDKEFSNARFVRNLVERIHIKALLRTRGEDLPAGTQLPVCAVDLETTLADDDMTRINLREKKVRLGFML